MKEEGGMAQDQPGRMASLPLTILITVYVDCITIYPTGLYSLSCQRTALPFCECNLHIYLFRTIK